MMNVKDFVKSTCPWLVMLKRRIQFVCCFLVREFDAWVALRKVDRNICQLCHRPRLRVAFLVVSSAEFQMEGVYRLMLQSKRFEPVIVVIPQENWPGIDARRDVVLQVEKLRKIHGERVVSSWGDDGWVDITGMCDLCVTANPYDWITNSKYRIRTLAHLGIPVILSNYFYYHGSTYSKLSLARQDGLSFVWRYYAENKRWMDTIERHHPVVRYRHGVVFSGAPKLDLLSGIKNIPRKRKRVLLCPHHSIRSHILPNYGNFDRYADFFLELPARYPDIDWIFRPHPLLKSTLESNGIWPKGAWESYVTEFSSHENASYRPTGSYWDLFVNSDGMIQDCGSFLPEYHCSGHPQCYILKSPEHAKTQFDAWGEELLSYAYKAFSRQDILDFVDKVIVGGDDSKRVSREQFVKEKILVNYPHVSEWILTDLKKALEKE